jgi:hypothetical protein
MRALSLIIAAITIPLLLFLWLHSLRELTAAVTAHRDWFAPLALALGFTVVILFVIRLTHRFGANHRR